jgi:hypothetical protein
MTNKGAVREVIAIQSWLRPALSEAGTNKDLSSSGISFRR